MMGAAIALALAFGASLPVERFAAGRGAPALRPSSLAARLLAVATLYLFWFGIFRRPYLTGFAVLATIAVVTAISVRKRQLVAEPLVFSDFALLRTIARHPDLYYLGFMRDPRFVVGALALTIAAGTWIWLEPPIVAIAPGIAITAASLAAIALAWRSAHWSPVAAALARQAPEPALEEHVGRWGLLLTLATYALRWHGEIAAASAPGTAGEAHATADEGPTLVVVVQLESFTDPVRSGLGREPLPGLQRARELARFFGPLVVPTHGAFTMRSEHEVLTGLPGKAAFRGFDPYLSSAGHVPPTLASALRALGFRTLFMHPFRASFFNRAAVMPRLGFDEFRWEADFTGAERHGPYVSDRAVVDRILAELRPEPSRPTLVMAVTMENHGPWSAGRLPDEPDPTRQYLRHLASADRAISALIEGLSARDERSLLCVYGDHPPILPGLDPSGAPETEYALVELGTGSCTAEPRELRLSADALGRLLGALALGRPLPGEVPRREGTGP